MLIIPIIFVHKEESVQNNNNNFRFFLERKIKCQNKKVMKRQGDSGFKPVLVIFFAVKFLRCKLASYLIMNIIHDIFD